MIVRWRGGASGAAAAETMAETVRPTMTKKKTALGPCSGDVFALLCDLDLQQNSTALQLAG